MLGQPRFDLEVNMDAHADENYICHSFLQKVESILLGQINWGIAAAVEVQAISAAAGLTLDHNRR